MKKTTSNAGPPITAAEDRFSKFGKDFHEEWYQKIIQTFHYDPLKDVQATNLLHSLLRSKSMAPTHTISLLHGKPAIIYGAGPSLEDQLSKLVESTQVIRKYVHVAADGAARPLLKLGVQPQLVVTDLDGLEKQDLLQLSPSETLLAIHAHGDNIGALRDTIPKLPQKILGTTQSKSTSRVHNVGGFTDGDRAFILTALAGASNITLCGMDFGKRIGNYSKTRTSPDSVGIKRQKLRFGKDIIEWSLPYFDTRVATLTSNARALSVPYISSVES